MHFEWWVGSDRFGYKNSKSRIALFEFAACTMLRLARQRLLEFMYRVWYIAVRSPCPKRRGGSWTTPNQSLRSPSSRSDFDDDNPNTGPAVCAGQARDQCSTSAVLPGRCVTGGVVAESFNCLCLTPVRLSSLTTRSEGHRFAQTVSNIDHASTCMTLSHMPLPVP